MWKIEGCGRIEERGEVDDPEEGVALDGGDSVKGFGKGEELLPLIGEGEPEGEPLKGTETGELLGISPSGVGIGEEGFTEEGLGFDTGFSVGIVLTLGLGLGLSLLVGDEA